MLHLLCPNPALDRTLITEHYEKGAANRPIEVRDFAGGKSFNVAYAINQLNFKSDFTIHTILGGYFGDYVEELASENQIPLTKTSILSNTRICSIIVDVSQNNVYPLYEKGNKVDESIVNEYTEKLLESVNSGDTVALSGSFLPGFPNDYILRLGEKLKEKNVTLCVDTSGEPLRHAFSLKPKFIKINDEELLDIFPNIHGETIDSYVSFFNDEWDNLSEYFIVTLGKNGVIAKMQNSLYYLKSNPIEAKNPIASGDFFFGTLLANIESNKTHEDALLSAISASTANCLNWFPEFTQEQYIEIKNNHITITQYK
ncbi:1-phosphofructokinase family hexose kinase [Ruoffia tabacinasalis]|uniref:1-phosphofructokinase family hexose kinase n=1 Tax=Ruoffia tabacinasalis TaxID=87458 RepID=UPI003F9634E1